MKKDKLTSIKLRALQSTLDQTLIQNQLSQMNFSTHDDVSNVLRLQVFLYFERIKFALHSTLRN